MYKEIENRNFIFEFNSMDKTILLSNTLSNNEKDTITYETNYPQKTDDNVNFDRINDNAEELLPQVHIRRNKIIIIVILIILAVGMITSKINIPGDKGNPEKISTTEEEMSYKKSTHLNEMKPLSKDEGDAFFYEDNVIDAYGNTMNSVVHPGSTGTVKSTGGGGAHPAQGFNRTYQNDGYATFTGELFISKEYSAYTQHTLTLYFEVYGDGQLLYEAPHWKTGNSYEKLPFEVDILNYNEIRIHFEAINDKNLFSWEDCVFGVAEPKLSKMSIQEQQQ